jgi:LPXTG-motif cell wall-anchored protein
MKKKLILLFTGISFIIGCVTASPSQVHAATYENRTVVRFYQEEETQVPEIVSPDDNTQGVLPQTGSSFSYLGILGMILLVFVWWLKKRRKEKITWLS